MGSIQPLPNIFISSGEVVGYVLIICVSKIVLVSGHLDINFKNNPSWQWLTLIAARQIHVLIQKLRYKSFQFCSFCLFVILDTLLRALQNTVWSKKNKNSFLTRNLHQRGFTATVVLGVGVARVGGSQTTLKAGRGIRARPTETETEKSCIGTFWWRFPVVWMYTASLMFNKCSLTSRDSATIQAWFVDKVYCGEV